MNKRSCRVFIILLIICSLYSPKFIDAKLINRLEIEKQGDVIWEVPTDKKQVAITFDDGPDPVYTPMILDVLKEYDVQSTFFLIGKRMEMYPEVVQRELKEGHEIANHSYNHRNFYNISPQRALDEIRKTESLLNTMEQVGSIKLFRPPGGTLTEQNLELLKKEGYKVILWSWHQDPRDWANPGTQQIAKHVLKNVKNGDIILLHDSGGNREQTVSALKIILPKLKEEGYTIVTINELINENPIFQAIDVGNNMMD